MSKLEVLIKNFHDPSLWRQRAFPYLVRRPVNKYLKFRYTPPAPECRLMDEDWDNVIILDACRYDQFERHNILDGEIDA